MSSAFAILLGLAFTLEAPFIREELERGCHLCWFATVGAFTALKADTITLLSRVAFVVSAVNTQGNHSLPRRRLRAGY